MALREFEDERGAPWKVCDVIPSHVERRAGGDRRKQKRPGIPDRRQRRQHRMVVAPRFRAGWLVFESPAERRRLGPVPPGWDRWPDEQLRLLLRDAETLRPIG